MPLTGRFAFRRTLSGKIVLKVEELVQARWPFSRTSTFRKRWRDARLVDLTEAEMRTLMDLRNRPQLISHIAHAAAASHPRAAQGEAFAPHGQAQSFGNIYRAEVHLANGH